MEKGESYNELKTSTPNKRTRSCMRTMDFKSQLQLLDIDRKDPSKSGRTNGISKFVSVKQPVIKLIDCQTVSYCKCCWLPVIGTITLIENGIIEYSENCAKY